MPDCLICGRETSATHFGIDACRACIVFYRRNKNGRDKLRCINGKGICNDLIFRTWLTDANRPCRKCRVERIYTVLSAGNESGPNEPALSPCSSSSDVGTDEREEFDATMNAPSTSDVPDAEPSHSIIEKIRSNHRSLSTMRRTAELQLRDVMLDPFEADKDEFELVPCTYKIMNEATRILITGLFEFIPAIFPEFNDLEMGDKALLIRNYQRIFHGVDASMRAQRRRGTHSKVLFGSYTTYLSPDAVDIYFSDCPNQANVAEAARVLRDCILENCVAMQKQFARVLTTEDEYLALLGLAFWSVEYVDPNERLSELATRYRTEILSDLSARYRKTSGEAEGMARIGEMCCFLILLKSTELNLKWEYEIYRILDVFDDSTNMYSMQLHRADIES